MLLRITIQCLPRKRRRIPEIDCALHSPILGESDNRRNGEPREKFRRRRTKASPSNDAKALIYNDDSQKAPSEHKSKKQACGVRKKKPCTINGYLAGDMARLTEFPGIPAGGKSSHSRDAFFCARCWLRPAEADLKNPNLGRPDFVFSYRQPKELDEPFAILEHLPHNPLLRPPKLKSRGA